MKYLSTIPPMLEDEELIEALEKYPTFTDIHTSKSNRLIHAQDVFNVYVPNKMSVEVYNLVYFLLLQSCHRKEENKTFRSSNNDSALLCGVAGIGKSETVLRIADVLFPKRIVEMEEPYLLIVPILVVEVSTIASFKSFLLSVLCSLDRIIGTNYGNVKTSVTTDELLSATSKALNLHVLLLVIEEFNFINDGSRAYNFSNQIVALINIVNVSILFVATPKALSFFASTDYLARRSLGKAYKELDYEEFEHLTLELSKYNYTIKGAAVDHETIRYLYKVCNGNPALLKQVLAEAQVYAITTGYEKLDKHSLSKAAENKLATMRPHLENDSVVKHQREVKQKAVLSLVLNSDKELVNIFANTARKADKDSKNMINHIKQFISVEEIDI